MKKIRSYTSIWNVEKVLYAINDVNLPFPVTFTQITWFVLTEFIIILYSGCETMTDLAYYLIDEEQVLGEIPSSLQNYIDYEAYGRDLDIEGTFIATNAGIWEVLR